MSPRTGASDEEIQAWVNGELPEADHARVAAAVASDPHATAQLDECLQLRALGARVREIDTRLTRDAQDELARARRRRAGRVLGTAAAIAAAAVVVVAWFAGRTPHDREGAAPDLQLIMALGSHRRIEARLSWPAADHHRGYETERAGGPRQVEELSFELLAGVERGGDPRALVAANLLVGNLDRARQELDRAPDTADTWSDRAAIALVADDPERALSAADQALARTGDHAQARWNRALALAGLGLERSAAAAFAQLAQRGEPGWRLEAAARAAVLEARRARHTEAWTQAKARAAGMVTGGPPALDEVDDYPALVRLHFYDAVRAAPSPERVQRLAPLARALDARAGGDVLAHYVARVAALPFARRARLAARYGALVASNTAEAERRALLQDLRAAGAEADDLALGALPLVGPERGQIVASDAAEYARRAAATGDPWFAVLASEQRAMLAIAAGDAPVAARELRDAASRCKARDAVTLRCFQIARLETYSYQVMHRIQSMSEAWARLWRSVVGNGMVENENEALRIAIGVASLRDDTAGTGLGLAQAYLDEWAWSRPSCAETSAARDDIAQSMVNQNRLGEAKALLDGEPPCAAAVTARRTFLLGQLVHDRAQAAALQRDIAALRAAPGTSAGDRALLDHTEGRVLLLTAPDAGRVVLRRVIATADAADALGARVRGYSYSVLVQDAGRRGEWSDALALLAEERGASAPERCVLGAAEEEEAVFAVRGRDGVARGAIVPLSRGPGAGELAVPGELQALLAGCDLVDVYARNPYYGRSGLLAPGTAFRFRSAGTVPASPRAGPTVVIANVAAPPELHLSPLQPIPSVPGATWIEGADATPARVLAALSTASFIEVHSHGLLGVSDDDSAMLVLAPDRDGRYALTATDVADVKLAGHPVVILAACEAASAAPAFHAAWGLADAFLAAGASAVIASQAAIGDADAPRFFAGVRRRIQAGTAPARALRDEGEVWRAPAQRRWIDRLVVFQ